MQMVYKCNKFKLNNQAFICVTATMLWVVYVVFAATSMVLYIPKINTQPEYKKEWHMRVTYNNERDVWTTNILRVGIRRGTAITADIDTLSSNIALAFTPSVSKSFVPHTYGSDNVVLDGTDWWYMPSSAQKIPFQISGPNHPLAKSTIGFGQNSSLYSVFDEVTFCYTLNSILFNKNPNACFWNNVQHLGSYCSHPETCTYNIMFAGTQGYTGRIRLGSMFVRVPQHLVPVDWSDVDITLYADEEVRFSVPGSRIRANHDPTDNTITIGTNAARVSVWYSPGHNKTYIGKAYSPRFLHDSTSTMLILFIIIILFIHNGLYRYQDTNPSMFRNSRNVIPSVLIGEIIGCSFAFAFNVYMIHDRVKMKMAIQHLADIITSQEVDIVYAIICVVTAIIPCMTLFLPWLGIKILRQTQTSTLRYFFYETILLFTLSVVCIDSPDHQSYLLYIQFALCAVLIYLRTRDLRSIQYLYINVRGNARARISALVQMTLCVAIYALIIVYSYIVSFRSIVIFTFHLQYTQQIILAGIITCGSILYGFIDNEKTQALVAKKIE